MVLERNTALGILRRRVDLQQKQVVAATGMSKSQVSRYERGRDVPNRISLIKFLQAVDADFRLLHGALEQVKHAWMSAHRRASRCSDRSWP